MERLRQGFFIGDYNEEGSMESLGVLMGGLVKVPSHHILEIIPIKRHLPDTSRLIS